MLIYSSINDLLRKVARDCDLCLKPWRHSVFNDTVLSDDSFDFDNDIFDLTLRIECRSKDGQRFSDNDLEIEIYRSGSDLSITISWASFPSRPILWHGKHSVWMDSVSGLRATVPEGGTSIEALARRLRASFLIQEDC